MRGVQQIALVGSDFSGLVMASLLSQKRQVTLYEALSYLCGHTHTVLWAVYCIYTCSRRAIIKVMSS